jgi:hypothetical protein
MTQYYGADMGVSMTAALDRVGWSRSQVQEIIAAADLMLAC